MKQNNGYKWTNLWNGNWIPDLENKFRPTKGKVEAGGNINVQVEIKTYTVTYHVSIYIYTGKGNGTPLQFSCLENPMDRGAWWAAVHGVAKNRTRLSNFTFTFHFHALQKEMSIHSSVFAWRIPGMVEPGGLPSMGSHRVGHGWSNLVVVVYIYTYHIYINIFLYIRYVYLGLSRQH